MPSSIQLYSQAITDFKRLQGVLNEKQSKIGADSKADTFAELGSDLNSVQSFKYAIEKAKRYSASIKEAQRRNDAYFEAIQQAIQIADDFKQNLTIENSGATREINNLTANANTQLAKLQSVLNAKDGANYIFAGSKTSVQPVNNLVTATNLSNGVPTANYYSGDDFTQAVDVSTSQRVDYGLTGAQDAFMNLIAAMNFGKATEANGGVNYEDADRLWNEAKEQLIALQVKIGDNARIFEDNLDLNTKAQSSFETKYAEANEPDIIALTIETSQATATLEASFSAFSKISNLSLLNYL